MIEPRISHAALIVVAATIVAGDGGSISRSRMTVESAIPSGLPDFAVPNPRTRLRTSQQADARPSPSRWRYLSFADTSVLSRSYAARSGDHVDQDQELRGARRGQPGHGAVPGLTRSLTAVRRARPSPSESAGSKTQLTGLVGAVRASGRILVFASGLFGDLPTAVPGSHRDRGDGRPGSRSSRAAPAFRARPPRRLLPRADVAFGGVAVFGVLWGPGIAIGLSVLAFLWRAWHPYDAVLGRDDRRQGLPRPHALSGGAADSRPVALSLRRPALLRERDHLPGAAPLCTPYGDSPVPVKMVVVAAEPITDLDSTAADMVAEASTTNSRPRASNSPYAE